LKEGKAEVLNIELGENGDLRVKLAGRADRDLYIKVMRALSAPGTSFELVGDTEVLCKPPPVR
jgi:hypothetical protein